jgi:hypothetical protein
VLQSQFSLSVTDGGNEQRVAIKFCFKAGLSATETLVLVQKAYGNKALNRSNVMCLPHLSSIFKNISPKTFGPHCVHTVTKFLPACFSFCAIVTDNSKNTVPDTYIGTPSNTQPFTITEGCWNKTFCDW